MYCDKQSVDREYAVTSRRTDHSLGMRFEDKARRDRMLSLVKWIESDVEEIVKGREE